MVKSDPPSNWIWIHILVFLMIFGKWKNWNYQFSWRNLWELFFSNANGMGRIGFISVPRGILSGDTFYAQQDSCCSIQGVLIKPDQPSEYRGRSMPLLHSGHWFFFFYFSVCFFNSIPIGIQSIFIRAFFSSEHFFMSPPPQGRIQNLNYVYGGNPQCRWRSWDYALLLKCPGYDDAIFPVYPYVEYPWQVMLMHHNVPLLPGGGWTDVWGDSPVWKEVTRIKILISISEMNWGFLVDVTRSPAFFPVDALFALRCIFEAHTPTQEQCGTRFWK